MRLFPPQSPEQPLFLKRVPPAYISVVRNTSPLHRPAKRQFACASSLTFLLPPVARAPRKEKNPCRLHIPDLHMPLPCRLHKRWQRLQNTPKRLLRTCTPRLIQSNHIWSPPPPVVIDESRHASFHAQLAPMDVDHIPHIPLSRPIRRRSFLCSLGHDMMSPHAFARCARM